mmetsp:Transcript_160817/g.296543  ORF Transcript_160817/g.296543 Transcript_160817/m.296543 type:complete len:475 (-) Transcript_160817:28-1452(-)
MAAKPSPDELKAKFVELSKNYDGILYYEEFSTLLKKGNPEITDAQCQRLFKASVKDGANFLDFNEFVNFVFAGAMAPMARPAPPSPETQMMMSGDGKQLIETSEKQYNDLMAAHMELVKAHGDLLKTHNHALSAPPAAAPSHAQQLKALQDKPKEVGGKVGIVRLDGANYSAPKYSKKSVLGDAASSATWEAEGDKVFYQRPEGYTFTVCKYGFTDPNSDVHHFEKEGVISIKGNMGDSNHMFIPNRRGGPKDQPRPRQPSRTEPWIEDGKQIGVNYIYESNVLIQNFRRCVQELVQDCNVNCITSACGFMANTQKFASSISSVPCLMSSLELLPMMHMMSSPGDKIIVMTADDGSFSDAYDQLIRPEWNIPKSRIELVGLQHVEGFGAEVAHGTTVDVKEAEGNIVKAIAARIESLKPVRVACLLSECTELPGYTNTLREKFGFPVFDAISAAQTLLHGIMPRDEYTHKASYG